jgi:subtilisin family serine protease
MLKPRNLLAPAAAVIAPESLESALVNDQRIETVRKIEPQGSRLGTFGVDPSAPQAVHVVRMHPDYAVEVSQRIGAQAYVERDEFLRIARAAPPFGVVPPGIGVAAAGTPLRVTITVAGKDNARLEGAQVVIFGSQSSTQGVTDQSGQATLTIPGETGDTIIGVVVTPRADYWSTWVSHPHLDPNGTNLVSLTPLDQTFPGFPDTGIVGWGVTAMNVDQLPPTFRGQGVKVAVIDSGIAARTHQDLQGQVDGGYNIVAQNPDTWDEDDEGHGTHCAGIIAALDAGHGIRGIAPGVKLRSYKIFPGGQFSDLIDALNRCIQDDVDVVNLSLGTDQTSNVVEQWIQQAKQQGIACIVAAGNSSGPVQFPASSPNVLAVAAIGRQGTFPAGAWQTTEAVVGDGVGVSSDGYFSPVFTDFGSDISVCAPGVAIVSCFPPNDYAVMDGTSMAAPHVTGLAALVLAHHPAFQGPYRQRNAQRVDRLFATLMQGARPLVLGPLPASLPRTGAGLVDAVRTFNVNPVAAGVGPGIAQAPALTPQTWTNFVHTITQGIGTPQPVGSIGTASVTPEGVMASAGGNGGSGAAGTLSPQDWTNIVSSIMGQIPWQQIFSLSQAQPQPAGRGGLGTMGVTPTTGGNGGAAAAGTLSPQEWANVVSSIIGQLPWQQIFSLFQAQPQLAGRGV